MLDVVRMYGFKQVYEFVNIVNQDLLDEGIQHVTDMGLLLFREVIVKQRDDRPRISLWSNSVAPPQLV